MEKEADIETINENFERKITERVGQEQIHGLLFVEKLSWQQIIYDLINTEQLDPWDINISLLTNKFLEKVRELEEANFFISSQVLLAASLLLRIKSEILLNHYIPELDEVLFGRKKEEKKYSQERIELDEEVPGLVLRTPLPRFRKVTLEELMSALGHAIKTENRRIRKVIIARQQELETALALPRHRINLKDRIRVVNSRLKKIFANRQEKLAFSELAGKGNENRIATFIPLLHLDNQHKVWLEQHKHLDEIWILLKHLYEKQNAESLAMMKKEAEEAIEKLVKEESEMRAQIAEEEKKNGGKKKFAGRFKKKGEDEYEESEESSEKEFNDPMGELTGFDKPADEIEEIRNEGED
jgi:segregation and condensation protein A